MTARKLARRGYPSISKRSWLPSVLATASVRMSLSQFPHQVWLKDLREVYNSVLVQATGLRFQI